MQVNRQKLLPSRYKIEEEAGSHHESNSSSARQAFFALVAAIPLDVFRFHLLGKPGAIASGFGLLLFIAGWWMIAFSFKESTFAAPVVKHQVERHQTVIDTGVYGIVRHPMYAGGVLLMVGMPLWLESYAANVLKNLPNLQQTDATLEDETSLA